MIVLNIDVTKVEKNRLFKGKKGTYLEIVLMENRGGEDQYGNLGFCVQGVTKEERAAGQLGPIIGNYKEIGKKPAAPARTESQGRRPAPTTKPAADEPEEDCPF